MEGEATVQAGTQGTGTPAVSAAPAPAAAVPAQTESYINPDGTFKEGWQKQYVPQEFQHLQQIFSGVKTPADMAKMIGNQNTVISKQGKGIFVPGPDANQAERDFFNEAIGVPKTADGFKFEVPKEMQEFYHPADEDVMEFKQSMLKAGATPQVFDAAKGVFLQMIAKSNEELKKDPMPFYEEIMPLVQPILMQKAEQELKAKWGDAYDNRLLLANRAIAENTKEGPERDSVLARIGNDPIAADFIATIMQKHFTEGSGVDTSTGSPAGTSMNLDQRIEKLMADPCYANGNLNPMRHADLVKEVNNLISQKTGGKMLE